MFGYKNVSTVERICKSSGNFGEELYHNSIQNKTTSSAYITSTVWQVDDDLNENVQCKLLRIYIFRQFLFPLWATPCMCDMQKQTNVWLLSWKWSIPKSCNKNKVVSTHWGPYTV